MKSFALPALPQNIDTFVPPVDPDLLYVEMLAWYKLRLFEEAQAAGFYINQMEESDGETLLTSLTDGIDSVFTAIDECFTPPPPPTQG